MWLVDLVVATEALGAAVLLAQMALGVCCVVRVSKWAPIKALERYVFGDVARS